MKKVAFHNLGCKVNSYELDIVQQEFVKRSYVIVPFDQLADIYIINTCTVTNIADRKSRQMLHQAKKRNPDAIVVAMGCYVETAGEKVEMDDCIDIAIGNQHKKDAAEIVEGYIEDCRKRIETQHSINNVRTYEDMTLTATAEHTRAYIKIQDGCNQFCSYCIIPFARGRVRSRKASEIVAEIEGLVDAGYQEFVLTGIHISSYGVDFVDDTSLLELILCIARIPGVRRLRLGSLEPRIVTEDFAKAISELPNLCPHFHLSLQSGCDATLQRMNRRYTTAEFLAGVQWLRKYFDRPAITTDVIVGFPGETDEEFAATEAFLSTVQFFEMHIFPYSMRQGTVAAKLPEQVPGEIKKDRSNALLALDAKLSHAYRASFLEEEVDVLWEEVKTIDGAAYYVGHTPMYVKVAKKVGSGTDGAEMLCDDRGRSQVAANSLQDTTSLCGKIERCTIVDFLTVDTMLVQ